MNAALKVGRTGNPIARLFGAVKALFSEAIRLRSKSRSTKAELRAAVIEHDPGPGKVTAKEPSLTRKSGVFVAVAGSKGSGHRPG